MVRTESLRAGVIAQSLASDPAVSAQGFYDLIVTDLRPDLANIRVPLTVLYVHPGGRAADARADRRLITALPMPARRRRCCGGSPIPTISSCSTSRRSSSAELQGLPARLG